MSQSFLLLGFFISLSKNWEFFGNLGFHVGANKNIWEKTGVPEDDSQVNLFFGIFLTWSPSSSDIFAYEIFESYLSEIL